MLRQIIDTCRNFEHIIIFGVGKVGKRTWKNGLIQIMLFIH